MPGVHDPLDPEYSILKQRLARRARYERLEVQKLDLVSITKLANRSGGPMFLAAVLQLYLFGGC